MKTSGWLSSFKADLRLKAPRISDISDNDTESHSCRVSYPPTWMVYTSVYWMMILHPNQICMHCASLPYWGSLSQPWFCRYDEVKMSKSHYRFEDVVLIDFSSIHPSLPYKDIPSHLFSFGQTWISLHFSTWDWCYFACEPFHLLYFSDGVETWNQPPLSSENGKMACVMFCENMDPQLLAMAPSFTLVPSRAASKCWS